MGAAGGWTSPAQLIPGLPGTSCWSLRRKPGRTGTVGLAACWGIQAKDLANGEESDYHTTQDWHGMEYYLGLQMFVCKTCWYILPRMFEPFQKNVWSWKQGRPVSSRSYCMSTSLWSTTPKCRELFKHSNMQDSREKLSCCLCEGQHLVCGSCWCGPFLLASISIRFVRVNKILAPRPCHSFHFCGLEPEQYNTLS